MSIYFYTISLVGSPLGALTYHSEQPLSIGDMVEIPFRSTTKKGVVVAEDKKPTFQTRSILNITDSFFPKSYQKIAKFISNYYLCSIGEAYSLFVPFKKNDKKIKQKKEDICFKRLSSYQQDALDFLQKHKTSLLFGDTGSGKTEIYIHLMEKTLKQGKNVIFLMPEISLTPQMQRRLKEVFLDKVAIWHSKVAKKSKEKILRGIEDGDIRIIAGARSALFLPLDDIGLIIVDEEHDSSYKSGSRPRYNARDLSVYFGSILGCRVVLGSATPSLESYHRYPFFRLKGSFSGSKKEYIYEKNTQELSQSVINELSNVLEKKKQAVVFLPTRANFKYISCFECGEYVTCPFCSVGLSLHKDKNALVCHYCGYIEPIPKECPKCKSSHLSSFRMGTQEVVDRLKMLFKDANIVKFDSDAIKSINVLSRVLSDFNDGKIDILVGTQMLSKGHDYSNISLSVILGLDTIMAQNDFRARQNALSLAVQIAGRSGRVSKSRVLLQSSNEEFFKRYMGDYERFLKEELKFREELYPPYRKLSRLLISHKDDKRAKEITSMILKCLRKHLQKGVEIVGSSEANIKKIAKKYRYQILLRATSSKSLLQTIAKCRQKECEVDMDPISFI